VSRLTANAHCVDTYLLALVLILTLYFFSAAPSLSLFITQHRLAFGSYLGISAAAAWFLASTAFLCLTIRNSRKKVNDKKKKQQQGDGTISTLTDGAANI
jgi:membrane protein implicated in regulation of membrane protease activity